MGLFSSKVYTYDHIPFIIERQIVVEPVNIMLGVRVLGNRELSNNTFRNQCIKIDNKYYSLLRFLETKNGLVYDFENNIKLTLMKNNSSNNIYYNIKTDLLNISDTLTPIMIKWFKPINTNSKELDRIDEFIKF